jgi:hypothetical protein
MKIANIKFKISNLQFTALRLCVSVAILLAVTDFIRRRYRVVLLHLL